MEPIYIITTNSHDKYPWLVRAICRIRGIPVPSGCHVRLTLRGTVYELSTVGVTEQTLEQYVNSNTDETVNTVCLTSYIPDLVVDRISTLALAGVRLRWYSVLEMLLTGKSDGMFCTDLPLVVLGYGRGERPLTPDELITTLKKHEQAIILRY